MHTLATTAQPKPGFVRTSLQGAPTAVNMARALMLHAMAVLDEAESLSEAEFVGHLFREGQRKACTQRAVTESACKGMRGCWCKA